ncbi:hypothetical protein [Mycobacterium sp. Aquia_213]|uniref:hypothetical protein n=1 Tax=Mycobacterium sp. Aquia_213 TaxID=2991728 RepID=UPI00226F7E26|nr:hypothetical protein [Mycobacterium sp. Aquia_213]WAC91950.1 hypothetical protein LMQ14_01645 [Mycobacterium sp. Aquia_213]
MNRLPPGSDIHESPPWAVLLVVVDLDEVVAEGLLLTDSPRTSNRHEWNKP